MSDLCHVCHVEDATRKCERCKSPLCDACECERQEFCCIDYQAKLIRELTARVENLERIVRRIDASGPLREQA